MNIVMSDVWASEDMLSRVILEGCNSEWAQERYLPTLAREAAEGNIKLGAIDIEDDIKLGSSQIEKDWQVAQSKNRAHYLNKEKDRQTYDKLSNANYVFIVTPDRFHSIIATFWLDRLAPEGKIFIEKPLDASRDAALKLKEKIERKGKGEAVFAFDHYLARAYPFLHRSKRYINEIGGIKEIEFRLVESDITLKSRAKTLDKGAIFDLFCHVLAVACAAVTQNTTCSAKAPSDIELNEVKAARCAGCPISGETFARVKFTVNPATEVVSDVGYIASIDKYMMLRGNKDKGRAELDFMTDKFKVFDSSGKQIDKGELLAQHVGTFLERILYGEQHPLSVPGVLSFDAALGILTKLDETKRQIGNKLPEY